MPVSAPARVRSNTRFLPGLRLTGDSALVKLKSSQSLPSSKDDMGESITTEVLACDGVDRAAACSSFFFCAPNYSFFWQNMGYILGTMVYGRLAISQLRKKPLIKLKRKIKTNR